MKAAPCAPLGIKHRRARVALTCLLLCAPGLWIMAWLAVVNLAEPIPGAVMLIPLWAAAWGTLAAGTWAWVCDSRWERRPIVGAVALGAGVLGLFPASFGVTYGAEAMLLMLTIEVALMAPALLLAGWLVRFHWQRPKRISPVPSPAATPATAPTPSGRWRAGW